MVAVNGMDTINIHNRGTARKGQVSNVRIFGNTVYDEETNAAKSTNSVRIRSVNEDETKESIAYVNLPPGEVLRSLPNGVKDEVSVSDGVRTQRVSSKEQELTIDGNLSWVGLSDGSTGFYRMYVLKWVLDKNIKQSTAGSGTAISSDGDYPILGAVNNAQRSISIGGAAESGHLYVAIEKTKINAMPSGETSAGFKEYLNQYPITLTYQLAEPVIIENVKVKYFENGVLSGGLSCFGPNTTVMQEPVATSETKPNEYNQIQLPTDKGLVELVGCYKDNGVTMVDCLEDATLDTGTGIVTINGADITKDYFVAATIDKSNTTLGTIGMRYPI